MAPGEESEHQSISSWIILTHIPQLGKAVLTNYRADRRGDGGRHRGLLVGGPRHIEELQQLLLQRVQRDGERNGFAFALRVGL